MRYGPCRLFTESPVELSRIQERVDTVKNGQRVHIRTALPEDAERVIALTKTVMETSPHLMTTVEEFHLTNEIEKEILDGLLLAEGKLAIVAECDGRVVGFLDFHNGRKKRNQHHGSFGMSVLYDYRGLGIGTALLEELLRWAEASPLIEKVSLEVFSENKAAVALYEKAGFQREGRQLEAVKLGDGTYDDLLIMSRFTK